jgi:hypothetical protein
LFPLQRLPAALCSSGAAGHRTIPFRRWGFTGHSTHCVRTGPPAPLRFLFAPSRRSLPSQAFRPGRLRRRPAGHSCTGSSIRCIVRRNRPAAGHFRGLAELPLKNLGRRSATFMGFDSGSALRSFTPFGGCEIAFAITRPRAVEPRAARDYCDVRHRCRGPVAAIRTADGLGPGIAPASGV